MNFLLHTANAKCFYSHNIRLYNRFVHRKKGVDGILKDTETFLNGKIPFCNQVSLLQCCIDVDASKKSSTQEVGICVVVVYQLLRYKQGWYKFVYSVK